VASKISIKIGGCQHKKIYNARGNLPTNTPYDGNYAAQYLAVCPIECLGDVLRRISIGFRGLVLGSKMAPPRQSLDFSGFPGAAQKKKLQHPLFSRTGSIC